MTLGIAALLNAIASAQAQPAQLSDLDRSQLQVFGEVNTPPSLDDPEFVPLDLAGFIGGLEPVISVRSGNAVKAYPVRVLAVHGVVNDVLNEMPIAVTYCGPCSSATVLKRPSGPLKSTGALYQGTMLITDETGSAHWQQRNGQILTGTGSHLTLLNAKIISMARFRQDNTGNAQALVLRESPQSRLPDNRTISLPQSAIQGSSDIDDEEDETSKQTVRVLGDKAWSLELLAPEKRVEQSDVIILWQPDSSFSKRKVQGPRP